MSKMVFFDIDGTLFDHRNNRIPASTIEAIQLLKEKGIPVAIATGRAPFLFKDIREQTGISNFVSFNGSYVVFNEEVIHKIPLNKEELLALTKQAKKLDFPLVYFDEEGMRSTVADHPNIFESFRSLKFDYPDVDELYFQDRDIYQTLIFTDETEEHHYINKYNKFDFVRWHELSSDIVPKGGSKAKGIQQMIQILGLSVSDVVAFGDALNDLEMLQTVGIGVAMGNGLDEVKKAADFVTKPVDEDGIYYGLKHIGLL